VYVTFFRSFYIVFAALFSLLFVGAGALALNAALLGESLTTGSAVALAALCGLLIDRAVRYMRE
jgi:hypothetical protein